MPVDWHLADFRRSWRIIRHRHCMKRSRISIIRRNAIRLLRRRWRKTAVTGLRRPQRRLHLSGCKAETEILTDLLKKGELPLRLTHNDTKLNNVLLDPKTYEAVCIVDFDTIMPGLTAYDFGDAIRFGANTAVEDEPDTSRVSLSLPLYKAYVKGFMEGCGERLTPKEIETLPVGAKTITLEQGIRFLTDYLQGDTYYQTSREGQNLDRCRTQLALVADMERKWEQMQVTAG